jgi:hypothetical protein
MIDNSCGDLFHLEGLVISIYSLDICLKISQ